MNQGPVAEYALLMLTRHVQRATMILGAIMAALLFFLGGAALRLAMGPISLGPFAGAIEDALNRSVSGLVVRFDQAVLEWSRADSKINLVILGTRVFDIDGRIIAQAPKADLDFDAAELVMGRLSLRRFGLVGVQLTGIRSEQGVIRLGFGPDQGDTNVLEKIRQILQSNSSGGGTLETFSIRNARAAFRDERSGLFIVAPNTSFTLENKGDRLDASILSKIEISGVPAEISGRGTLRSSDGALEGGTIDIRGLSLAALAANSFTFAGLKPYRLVSDLSANFVLTENGDLASTTFHASGKGSIDSTATRKALTLDSFSAEGRYDGATRRLVLAAVDVRGKQISGEGTASLTLGWNGDALATVKGKADAKDVTVDLPDTFYEPLSFSRISVTGSYLKDRGQIDLQRLQLENEPFSADVAGTVTFSGKNSPAVTLQGTIAELPARDVLKYWPVDVGKGARAWIEENISEGRIGPLDIDIALAAGALGQDGLPDDALTVTFPFQGMTARYMKGLDLLTGARGEAMLTGDTFGATLASANVGPLAVSKGEIRIPQLHVHATPAHITAHTEGQMAAVLQLVDKDPLGYPKRFGIDPASAQGRASIDLDFVVPMLRSVTLDQVRIGVKANVSDLGIPIDRQRRLEHGAVNFAIDTRSLTAQGTGELSGVRARFKWVEEFAGEGPSTHVDLSGVLDDTARARLGLSEPKWLTGPIRVALDLTGQRFRFTEASLKADLTAATAETPTLKITKPAGVPATATATLHFLEGGALSVTGLSVESESIDAQGAMSFGAGGRLADVSLTNLRAGTGNDFALTLRPLPAGGLYVNIQGRSLDATPFFGSEMERGGSAKEDRTAKTPADNDLQEPLSLTARLDRIVLRENAAFRNVALAVSYGAQEKLTGFSLDALGPGSGKVTGRFSADAGMRSLTLDSEDAGSFVAAFTGFSSMRGGHLTARVSFPGDAAATDTKSPKPDYGGVLALSDIVLTDQPFIARLFAAGSLDGPLRLLQGEGISLSKVEAPFTVRGKMVTFHDGRASGPAIGATFAGMLDRETDRVDVAGTLVPVYGLNSMLGAVPILGDLLVSKKGEGVFGLTYAMKGNLNEPQVTVNPLSVLTPGIFRRLFEFATPKEAEGETPPAPASPPAH